MRLSYDAYGRLQKLTNENNEAYAFGWDALDRLIAQRDLDGSGRSITTPLNALSASS